MIVVDIETSGLDPRLSSVLSIGAVNLVDLDQPILDQTDPPGQTSQTFYGECRAFPGAHIEKEALGVNGFTLDQVHDPSKKSEGELVQDFIKWVLAATEQTFAGHNTSFDRDFIKEACHRNHVSWPFAQRTLDLHTLAYVDMYKNKIPIPQKRSHSDLSLDKILQYLGMDPEPKPHNALRGATLEAKCFVKFLQGR